MLNITDSFEETIVLSKTRKPAGSRVAAINSAVPPHTEIHAPYRTPWPSLQGEGEGKKTRGVCLDSGLSSSFSRRKITVRLATRGSSTLTAIAVVVFKRSSAETVRNSSWSGGSMILEELLDDLEAKRKKKRGLGLIARHRKSRLQDTFPSFEKRTFFWLFFSFG